MRFILINAQREVRRQRVKARTEFVYRYKNNMSGW